MTYEVTLERGDGWDQDGKLIRQTLVRVRGVETLEQAEYFYRMFYLPFTGDCRSQVTSGNWKLPDGRVIVRTFGADVKAIDGWPDATRKTSVNVSITTEHEKPVVKAPKEEAPKQPTDSQLDALRTYTANERIVARWESRFGVSWVLVFQAADGSYGFRAGDHQRASSGGHGLITEAAAIARGELEASFYNVTMRRVL